jgi:hypothetical protein
MTIGRLEINYSMNALRSVSLIVLLALIASGCAHHQDKSQAQLLRAYTAGQQAARAQMQSQVAQPQPMQQGTEPQVRVLGPVKNPVLMWSADLTLARALVQAEYLPSTAPTAITIYRNNQPLQIDVQSVLQGQDYPLFPGDIVHIQD